MTDVRGTRTGRRVPAAFVGGRVPWFEGDLLGTIYAADQRRRLADRCDIFPERITPDNVEDLLDALRGVEVLFTGWGMFPWRSEWLDQLPGLAAVFYAGGSVEYFAEPFLGRGITLCSGHSANAIPVAEFCLGQILLSLKGAHRNSAACRRGPWVQSRMPVGPGAYGETVALLGLGAVSRRLIEMLRPFAVRVVVVPGDRGEPAAKPPGVAAFVDLETAFRTAQVVSNHLVDEPSNRGLLNAELFALLRPGATFLNTGRGEQVDTDGLVDVLRRRPDLTALLDVQHPEPPALHSPLYRLENVHLTSHIAGSVNDEVRRLGDAMVADFHRWLAGEPLHFKVPEPDRIVAAH
jgi:phosphoglycerate dehydrogenase-like enzyme